MVSLDVFRQDPFTGIQLTQAIEKVPFQPQMLGDLGIFEPMPIRTTVMMVEERQGKLVLIPTSPRGGPPALQRTTEQRKARTFNVPRLRHEDTIYMHELQNIRAFGTETELMQVQDEVARRLAGPTGLMRNLEYTLEFHRLAAVQGQLLDADGSTVLYNWFDEFEKVAPTEVAFNLAANTEGSLRPLINGVIRGMARASQGAFLPTTRVMGLCGDTFWDQLITHQDVVKTYYNWSDASELRKESAFAAMPYGGVDWFNYRGSDDTTTIAVGTDKVKFFPVGAPGVFQVAQSPGESVDFGNQPGRPFYAQMVPDRDLQEWVRIVLSAYPLHVCTRPEVLYSGKAGA